jgi:hypothetical protein
MADPLVTGTQLRTRVRDHKREGMLTRLAHATVDAWSAGSGTIDAGMSVHPWNAAIVAREALLTPRTSTPPPRPPSRADAINLCSLAANLDDPFLHGKGGLDDLQGMSLRIAFEQFPYSTHGFHDLARVLPFFDRDFTDPKYEVRSSATLR